MHIEQFEYIIEVAKTKSISSAAENLHVSQSGISKSITNLEEELGIKIFNRSRLGAIPTEKGKTIIKDALKIIMNIQNLKETALLQQGTLTYGEIKLAAIPSMLMTYLPKTLALFKKDFPKITLEITEKGSFDIVEDVKRNKVDIGLVYLFEDILSEELIYESLVETRINVLVNRDSLLAYNDTITPEDLINESIVLYNTHIWNRFIKEHFNDCQKPNILFASNNTEVIKKTVAEGLSIGFSTDLALKFDYYASIGEIVAIPFVNKGRSVTRSYGWIRFKDKHFSMATKKFLEYLEIQISKGNT